MRKTINTIALLYFIWLLLDAFNIPMILINFLLVGEVPGMQSSLPPSLMLALMTATAGIIVFELLARHIEIVWRIRRYAVNLIARRERLPRKRFEHI